MELIPFEVIKAAKDYEPEAVITVLRHFEPYIESRSQCTFMDQHGITRTVIDDELCYQAQIALFAAIAKFEFREPPEDFEI